MLTECFLPYFDQNLSTKSIFFMQDNATIHTAGNVKRLVDMQFPVSINQLNYQLNPIEKFGIASSNSYVMIILQIWKKSHVTIMSQMHKDRIFYCLLFYRRKFVNVMHKRRLFVQRMFYLEKCSRDSILQVCILQEHSSKLKNILLISKACLQLSSISL